jgi:hypothetical protein
VLVTRQTQHFGSAPAARTGIAISTARLKRTHAIQLPVFLRRGKNISGL